MGGANMKERTCQRCGLAMQVATTSSKKWCTGCNVIVRREDWQRHDAKRRPCPVHQLRCHHCTAAFEHSGKGQVPKYCPICRGTRGVHDKHRIRPAYAKGTARKHHLKHKYGLTQADWDILFDSQGRRCAICRTTDSARWDTDHCHETGRVRGILCAHCNRGIGQLRDDPVRLRAAADYLESHQGVEIR